MITFHFVRCSVLLWIVFVWNSSFILMILNWHSENKRIKWLVRVKQHKIVSRCKLIMISSFFFCSTYPVTFSVYRILFLRNLRRIFDNWLYFFNLLIFRFEKFALFSFLLTRRWKKNSLIGSWFCINDK